MTKHDRPHSKLVESGLSGLEQWNRLSRRSFTIQMVQDLRIREVEAQRTLLRSRRRSGGDGRTRERRGAEVPGCSL
ncbi:MULTISPECIES: hypothetical protein [unclassified Sphingomonas]|uniref:hypothetical protein n=1 Tax=unclassified Sphingomonas TaxID=196159 RepID=UPI0012E12D27|nr:MULTISPECIES: hypothetical protein [unclassified Sphingomonas]